MKLILQALCFCVGIYYLQAANKLQFSALVHEAFSAIPDQPLSLKTYLNCDSASNEIAAIFVRNLEKTDKQYAQLRSSCTKAVEHQKDPIVIMRKWYHVSNHVRNQARYFSTHIQAAIIGLLLQQELNDCPQVFKQRFNVGLYPGNQLQTTFDYPVHQYLKIGNQKLQEFLTRNTRNTELAHFYTTIDIIDLVRNPAITALAVQLHRKVLACSPVKEAHERFCLYTKEHDASSMLHAYRYAYLQSLNHYTQSLLPHLYIQDIYSMINNNPDYTLTARDKHCLHAAFLAQTINLQEMHALRPQIIKQTIKSLDKRLNNPATKIPAQQHLSPYAFDTIVHKLHRQCASLTPDHEQSALGNFFKQYLTPSTIYSLNNDTRALQEGYHYFTLLQQNDAVRKERSFLRSTAYDKTLSLKANKQYIRVCGQQLAQMLHIEFPLSATIEKYKHLDAVDESTATKFRALMITMAMVADQARSIVIKHQLNAAHH